MTAEDQSTEPEPGTQSWNSETDEPLATGEWLRTIRDPQLRRRLSAYNLQRNASDAVRAAFVLYEQRIREAAGISAEAFGTNLVKQAFETSTGILQPVAADGGERSGFYDLMAGTFKFYRNSIAHQTVDLDEMSARRVLSLIDLGFHLISVAVAKSFNLGEFVGAHEGEIRERRDFRIDVDGDGVQELVILLEFGPILESNQMTAHFSVVVLKKADGKYRRIPTEKMRGYSIYGPIAVELRNLTRDSLPDLVVSWSIGETQSLIFVLRRLNHEYVIARPLLVDGSREYYGGTSESGFTNHPTWTDIDFADVDGDGIEEIVQRCHFPDGDLTEMGYEKLLDRTYGDPYISRVWKWDGKEERFLMHK